MCLHRYWIVKTHLCLHVYQIKTTLVYTATYAILFNSYIFIHRGFFLFSNPGRDFQKIGLWYNAKLMGYLLVKRQIDRKSCQTDASIPRWYFFCGYFAFSVLRLMCLCVRLFICALWSPAGKGLTSWLSFVVSNCEIVTFLLVSWVRCGTWLYPFLIFAPLVT